MLQTLHCSHVNVMVFQELEVNCKDIMWEKIPSSGNHQYIFLCTG